MKKSTFALTSILCLVPLLVACGDGDECTGDECLDGDGCSQDEYQPSAGGAGGAAPAMCAVPDEPDVEIELVGTYTDDFGYAHEITKDTWDSLALSFVDNDQNYALGRSSEDAAYTPCLWSKLVWLEEDDRLYYCIVAFDAPSECAAEEAQPDSLDIEGGCNGFNWSELIRED